LGATSILLPSTEPFFSEFKLPIELSSGDVVQVPVSVTNETDSSQRVRLSAKLGGPVVLSIFGSASPAASGNFVPRRRIFCP
jgi:uncharacterized protein YfaS (alpha-2-macroglobulin family)